MIFSPTQGLASFGSQLDWLSFLPQRTCYCAQTSNFIQYLLLHNLTKIKTNNQVSMCHMTIFILNYLQSFLKQRDFSIKLANENSAMKKFTPTRDMSLNAEWNFLIQCLIVLLQQQVQKIELASRLAYIQAKILSKWIKFITITLDCKIEHQNY